MLTLGASDRFCGFGIEYLLPPGQALLALAVQRETVYSTAASVPADLASRYALGLRRALTRDQVYPTTYEVLKNACPPPAPEPELLEFLSGCEGPILDFGCGAGL